jgi:hypothetical protein
MATFQKLATSFLVVMFSIVTQVVVAASGLPMLKTSVASGEEYASRLESGNVNGSAILVAQALKRANRIEQVSVAEAAEYLRQGEVRTCPSGVRTLSAVWGGTELGTVSRAYRANETCLWDRNAGIWIGSLTCGNIDMEVGPDAVAAPLFEEELTVRGLQGEQGSPGKDGRDGEVRYVDVGARVLNYDQGTENRMSDRGRVELAQVAGDVLGKAIFTYGITKVFDKATGRWVEVEQIKADRDVNVARWNSQRGPTHLSVIQTGNCNAAFGSSTNCPTTITTPTDGGTRPPRNPHPPYQDPPTQPNPVLPIRPRPQEPILTRPSASEPILTRPRAGEPIGGNGLLPPRQNPSSGSDTGTGTIGPRIRPRGPDGG